MCQVHTAVGAGKKKEEKPKSKSTKVGKAQKKAEKARENAKVPSLSTPLAFQPLLLSGVVQILYPCTLVVGTLAGALTMLCFQDCEKKAKKAEKKAKKVSSRLALACGTTELYHQVEQRTNGKGKVKKAQKAEKKAEKKAAKAEDKAEAAKKAVKKATKKAAKAITKSVIAKEKAVSKKADASEKKAVSMCFLGGGSHAV